MARYKVRQGFVCWVADNKHYKGGEQVELTEEQYNKVKHQVEPVVPKRTRSSSKETNESL